LTVKVPESPHIPYLKKIRVSIIILLLLVPLVVSAFPVSAQNEFTVPTFSSGCVTVSEARQQAAAGKLRPEYARMTDAQLYALGFCADRPTTPSPGGCSPGYIKYTTSAGHCCQEGYPYYRDGSCYKCPEGYYTYDTSAGHCCKEGYPYYDSAADTCNSSDPNGGGDDGGVFAVFFIVMIIIVPIAAVAVGVSSAKKKTPPADPKGAPQEPRKMHGMMQFGGDAPGRDIIRGPGPIPRGFHGPAQSRPAYTAEKPPEGGESQFGIPPSWPSIDGGHPVDGSGVVPSALPEHPPVSGLQVSRVENSVHLDWKSPQHDPSREQLIGYEIFREEPVRASTALQRVSLGTVDPGVQTFDIGYLEGARFYNVRPIYRTPGGIVYGPGF
jgi:hypothetical protein